jgi:hypothetical protein
MINFVTFAGYPITSTEKYTLIDQTSVDVAQSSYEGEGDFCGEKIFYFTLNDTETTFLSF